MRTSQIRPKPEVRTNEIRQRCLVSFVGRRISLRVRLHALGRLFMIVSKKPEAVMEALEEVCVSKPKGLRPLPWERPEDSRTPIGCKRYLKEALSRVETMFGILTEIRTPSRRDHPDGLTSAVLNDDEHRKFQMLIVRSTWIVSISKRFDVAYVNILTSTIPRPSPERH
jgi:hypothetical protein